MNLTPVPRVPADDFRPSRWGGEPRVVTACPPGPTASELWNPEYLRSVVGDRDVPVREVHGSPDNVFQNLARGGSLPFARYLDWVVETADTLRDIAEEHSGAADITRAMRELAIDRFYYLDAKLEQLSQSLRDA